MSTEPEAVSVEELAQRIRRAAVASSGRPGHHLSANPASIPEKSDFYSSRIQACLQRARLKTFVKKIRPLRRLFRNQGAVNDSVIEALQHLAAQNQELLEEVSELRSQIWQGRETALAKSDAPQKESDSTPNSEHFD